MRGAEYGSFGVGSATIATMPESTQTDQKPIPTQAASDRQPTSFFIAHEPLTRGTETGGIKRGGAGLVPEMQSLALHQRGESVALITPKDGHVPTLPMPVHYFDRPDSASNDELLEKLTGDEWLTRFDSVLNHEQDAGVVYAHYYVAGGVAAELQSVRSGEKRPMVYMGHSWDRVVQMMDSTRKITPTREATERRILDASNGIIVATHAERAMLASAYGRDENEARSIYEKTHVVPLGADQSVFNPDNMRTLRAQHRSQLLPEHLQDATMFFLLGRMAPQKGQLQSVEAFAEVASQDRHANIGLSLYGGPLKGGYYDQVKAYVDTLPDHIKSRIVFHDVVPGHIAISSGDIFLGPSPWETWFLSLGEAMSAGKPTIVSDKEILREVGREGTLYVNENDPMDIASKMHAMIADPDLQRYSAAMNLQTAQTYTWEHSAAKLEQALNAIRQK